MAILFGSGKKLFTDDGIPYMWQSGDVTATPNEGYVFVGWEGSDSDSNSINITLNSNITLSPIFQEIFNEINKKSSQISKKYGTPFEFRRLSATGEPALTSIAVQDIIEKVSDKLNLTSVRMPSGAGHDAQEMALIAPTGMIFIPSKNGISHSAAEYSTISQVQNGYLTLLHSILAIDKLDSLD